MSVAAAVALRRGRARDAESHQQTRDTTPLALRAVACLLALLSAAQVVRSFVAIGQPAEIMYGESAIYDQAARLLRGEPLYQHLDRAPFTVAAYTPVYYWLVASLHLLFGAGFGPGRLASFISGLVIACLIARFTWRATRSRRAPTFAVILFMGLGMPWEAGWSAPWSALYKEDTLGVALALGGIALLGATSRIRWVIVAGTLVALAILTKQTLVAPLLAGGVWLWRRERIAALTFAGTCISIVGVTSLALEATTHAFLANVITANANPFQLEALRQNLVVLLLYQSGPLLCAVVLLAGDQRLRSTDELGLLGAYWLASLLPLVGLAKVGSSYNYWIELAAVTSIFTAAKLWTGTEKHAQRGGAADRLAALALVATPALWFMPTLMTVTVVRNPIHRPWPEEAQAASAEFTALIQEVHSTPGAVLADRMDVVVLANRPVQLEPYVFNILEQTGYWDSGPLVQRICRGDVTMVVVDRPIDSLDFVYDGYSHWPLSIRHALSQTMTLRGREAGRFVYRVRSQDDLNRGFDACTSVPPA